MKIICVGKLKEAYLRDAVAELSSRVSSGLKFRIIEVRDVALPERLSAAETAAVKTAEAAAILRSIAEGDYVAALAIDGRRFTSKEFAGFVNARETSLAFVIGGTLGLADEVLKRADISISFSKLTFPHQLMRVILLEQIARCCGL